MSRTPVLHLYPVTVWLDATRTVRLDACSDCFDALHEAGFHRVGTPLTNRTVSSDHCEVCRVKRWRGLRDPWRVKYRREHIAALLK